MEQASTTATTTDPQVEVIDAQGVYEIGSRTRAGLAHTVNILTDACTCEAGQHSVACWHLDYARALHYWLRYEQRRQKWEERQAAVTRRQESKRSGGARPAGMAALQECYG